jgi:hypothetical protein
MRAACTVLTVLFFFLGKAELSVLCENEADTEEAQKSSVLIFITCGAVVWQGIAGRLRLQGGS